MISLAVSRMCIEDGQGKYFLEKGKLEEKQIYGRKGYFDDYHHRRNNMEVQPIINQQNAVTALCDMMAY